MNTDDAINKIKEIEDRYWININIFCEEIVNEIVKPYCNRKGYTFIAGMGTWRFYDKYDKPIEQEDLPKKLTDLLNTDLVNRANDVGSMMPDCKP